MLVSMGERPSQKRERELLGFAVDQVLQRICGELVNYRAKLTKHRMTTSQGKSQAG